MQSSATAPTTSSQTPAVHSRVGRSSPVAPPGTVPDGFADALSQATGAAGPAAPVQTGPAGPNKRAMLPDTPAALPTPAATMTPAAPGANAGKPVNDGLAAPAAEPGQDKPAIKTITTDFAQTFAQPQLPQPAPLPVPITGIPGQTTRVPSADTPSPAGPDAAILVTAGIVGQQSPSTAAVAADQGPSETEPNKSAPIASVHTLHPVTLPGGPVAHTGPDPLAAATAEDKPAAPALVIGADAGPPPVSVSVLLIAAAPPSAIAAPHSAAAPPGASHLPAVVDPTPPSAAAQVGPALASFAASVANPGAPQHLTIRLDPAELGRVQVRIERTPGGPARVDLVVERPDTLLLLLRDQPQLHRALDLAGVPAADRTLQFHLAPPGATTPGPATPQSNADPGTGQQRPGQFQPHRSFNTGTASFLDDLAPWPPAASRRAGVDIMA